MEENAQYIAALMRVLGNQNRILILCHLMEGPLTVTQLSSELSHISQSALSQHLAVLKSHDIVDHLKKGLNITYSLKDERMLAVFEVLKANYCND